MKTVSLDVHSESSQLVAITEGGEVVLELQVATDASELRRIIGGIPGPKRVVFEEGPMSGMIHDALAGIADEIISCDPTRNALIALSEHKTDEGDARRLAELARLGSIREVYVPPEPYRTLRSLLVHDYHLMQRITGVKNRIKAMCRRHVIRYRGGSVYRSANRGGVMERLPSAELRWQMGSLYRELDLFRRERVGTHRIIRRICKGIPDVALLMSIPGVGPITAQTIVAWLVDPRRFKSRNALGSYAGLGLSQGWTNWQPIGRAKASKRGQRMLKRVLFLAAYAAALRSGSALARRYQARRDSGWEHKKAIRDVARKILNVAARICREGCAYDDTRVSVPDATSK